ncbi:MAG: prephenate dehydratase [Gammaproteobacteria bacterium]|nr:prephenate dehydratase [Gammaproteobacteria bacterium]
MSHAQTPGIALPDAPAETTIPLPELRTRIDHIDRGLLELLRARRDIAVEVAKTKDAESRPIRDLGREQDALVKLIQQGKEQGLDAHFVAKVFRELIEDSVKLQQGYLQAQANADSRLPEAVRVAYQGAPGAYSHQATEAYFATDGERLHCLPQPHFTAVIEAVERGEADYGVLPIENTTSGTISEVYDLLLHTRLAIVGEEKLRIEHCLLGLPGAGLNQIRQIYSHPVAAAQCTRFSSSLNGVDIQYWNNTATAAQKIHADADPSQAAIASEEAARLYGLSVIKRGIANQGQNYTRFIVVARTPIAVDARIPCKTSLVLATRHVAGALVAALSALRDHGINLTKIESRPILGNPWEEMFYLDLEGNRDAPAVRAALADLARHTRFLKILGSYPSSDLPEPVPTGAALEHAQAPAVPAETPPALATVQLGQTLIGAGGFVLGLGAAQGLSEDAAQRLAAEAQAHNLALWHDLARGPAQAEQEAKRAEGHEFAYLRRIANAAGLRELAPEVRALVLPDTAWRDTELLDAAGAQPLPVLLPRGDAGPGQWLEAAGRLQAAGNAQILLLETGLRTADGHRQPDLAALTAAVRAGRHPVLVQLPGDSDALMLQALKAGGASGALLSVDEAEASKLPAWLAASRD